MLIFVGALVWEVVPKTRDAVENARRTPADDVRMVAVVSSRSIPLLHASRIEGSRAAQPRPSPDSFERGPAKVVPHPRAPSVSDPKFVAMALDRMAAKNGDAIEELRRAYQAATELPPNLKNNTGHVRGYMVESLGREELARRFPGHHVDYGVEIRKGQADNVLGELDGIVIRDADGKVAAVAEAKASVERMSAGLTKVRAHLSRIQNSEVNHYQTRGEKKVWHFDDPSGPHSRTSFMGVPQNRCFAVGPKDAPERPDYVRLQISEASIGAIADLIVAQTKQNKANVALPLAA